MVANDEIIKENGGEIETDDIENIVLIDRPEYNSLNENEKPNWTRYSPSLQSEVLALTLNQLNDMINVFNQLGPIINKLSPLTDGGMNLLNSMGFSNLVDAIKVPVEMAKKLEATIGKISKLEIVNVVAEPLELICGLVGALAGLLYVIVMNPFQMISAYLTAIRQIDLTELKERWDADTPNLELLTTELNSIVIPDEEIKNFFTSNINSVVDLVKETSAIINQAINLEQIMESLEATDKTVRETLKTINTMGLNWLLPEIDELSKAMELNFEKVAKIQDGNPYTESANKMSSSVNNFLNNLPQKYILKSDLQKLKNYEQELQDKKEEEKGKNEGYSLGGDVCDEYLEKYEDISQVDFLEMEEYKKSELEKAKEEYKEESLIWLGAFEVGFNQGFNDRYENAQDYEYNKGYKDGEKQGSKDCKKLVSNFNSTTLSDEEIQQYINSMIQKMNLEEEGAYYHSGFVSGYETSFKNELTSLQKDDEKEGFNDGKNDGVEGCEIYIKKVGEENIFTITEVTNLENINTIIVNKNMDKESSYYQNGYRLGVEEGYYKSFNKIKNRVQEEINENDEEQGYKDGQNNGETYGRNLSNLYEKHLEDTGITSLTDRLIKHEEYHDAIVPQREDIEVDVTKSEYYQKGYKDGYVYGFTDGYYDAIEIIK